MHVRDQIELARRPTRDDRQPGRRACPPLPLTGVGEYRIDVGQRSNPLLLICS